MIDHVAARGCKHHDCINPAHLETVTHRTNVLRGRSFAAVNARKTACGRCGTPYDKANTYNYRGRRDCRNCGRRRVAEYKQRQAVMADLGLAA